MKPTILWCGLLLVSLISCNPQNDPAENIVFQLEELQVTELLHEKKFERFKNRLEKTNSQITPLKIDRWKEETLNDYYFLEDAYQLGYDSIPSIIARANYRQKILMGQMHGYLWGKLTTDRFDLTDTQLKEVYEKMKKALHGRVVAVDDNPPGHQKLLRSGKRSLNDLESQLNGSTLLVEEQSELLWPYGKFAKYKDHIYRLEKGGISNVMSLNDRSYVVLIDAVSYKEMRPFNDIKENLRKKLTRTIERDILDEMEEEIKINTRYVYHYPAIDSFFRQRAYLHIDSLNKKMPVALNPKMTLGEYYKGDSLKQVSVQDYVEHRKNEVFIKDIHTAKDISQDIKNIIILRYLWDKADSLNYTNDKEFLALSKVFFHNLVLEQYKGALSKQVTVNEQSISNVYLANRDRYGVPASITTTMLYFTRSADAYGAFLDIKQLLNSKSTFNIDSLRPNGLLEHRQDQAVHYEKCEFAANIKEKLFQFNRNVVLEPFKHKGMHAVAFVKEHQGVLIKPIEDVYPRIKRLLASQKRDSLFEAKLSELKLKYPPVINRLSKLKTKKAVL